jgi:hypothetical protein
MTCADLTDFAAGLHTRTGIGAADYGHRLLRGGLPEFFLAPTLPEHDFQEWIDAYWARDILFVVAADVSPGRPYVRTIGPLRVHFAALADLAPEIAERASLPE